MVASKRTFLFILMLMTLLFICYQSFLIFWPNLMNDPDSKYVQLVDQYHVIKMERLVLEEQFALAKTKERILKLATLLQENKQGSIFALKPSPVIASPPLQATRKVMGQKTIGLSLEQAKTYEQLEAYMTSSKPAPPALTVEEKELLVADGNDFTLQLMGVRDINELNRFARTNNLANTRIFHTYYLDKDWYVLTYGRFKNHTEALKAIETLPSNLRDSKPWIRQLSSVQNAIQMYR